MERNTNIDNETKEETGMKTEVKTEVKSIVLNLTQHPADGIQQTMGVIEPSDKEAVKRLLTFRMCPDLDTIKLRAIRLKDVAKSHNATHALIGGAPFLMHSLEAALSLAGIVPIYAFSRRESVETTAPDGSVTKSPVFKTAGFIPAGRKVKNNLQGCGYDDLTGKKVGFWRCISSCPASDCCEGEDIWEGLLPHPYNNL